MYICILHDFAIFGGSGSKFQSVNTKTSQFCPFFGVQELRKKHVNTKTSQFSPFFGFQELRKKHINTKTSQFSHFLDSRSWEKICQHQTSQVSSFLRFQKLRKNMYIHIICIYKYICTYVYYMILLYLEGSVSNLHSVNTKTSQFSPFFEFQELRKNMSTPKLVNFPHFWIPGIEKKHVYIYI